MLLTDTRAAFILGVSRTRLAGYVDNGLIPVVRLPSGEIRFQRSDLTQFIQEHRTVGQMPTGRFKVIQ